MGTLLALAAALAPLACGVRGGLAEGPVIAASEQAGMAPLPRGGGEEVGSSTEAAGRRLVREASIAFKFEDDEARAKLARRTAAAIEAEGGYVASESSEAMVLKVPADRLDRALEALAGLGKVLERSVHVEEVTASYTDLEIRITNARKTRDRLEQLLERAATVKDLLEVQAQLARATEELELLEGRMRLLKNQVTFATIRVTFETPVRPGPIGWVFYGAFKAVKWLFVWD